MQSDRLALANRRRSKVSPRSPATDGRKPGVSFPIPLVSALWGTAEDPSFRPGARQASTAGTVTKWCAVQQLTDPAILEPILNQDWPWAGFALADLEPEWTQHCEWRQSADSLVLLFDGLSPRLLCHYGDASGLATILASISEPRVWANVRPECEAVFRQFYRPEKCVPMRRMYLDCPVASVGEASPLTPADRPEIEGLLKTGEWVLFLPGCLASGHYYGVRENGRLIAMAGVHVASVRFNIGALGTVFTHPGYRGRGLAKVCSSHVLASLGRAGIRRVVLNVEDEKAAARRVYERLGFVTACTYLDGECVRVQGVRTERGEVV